MIEEKIETLRKELNSLIIKNEGDLSNSEIISKSQELDLLVLEYLKSNK